MKLSDSVSFPPQVMARQVGDESVILNLETGIYFGLDRVGANIWQLMAEGKTLAGICDAMQAEYEVDREVLEEDVVRLAQELFNQGLIIPVENV
jgi:hypothetical protein